MSPRPSLLAALLGFFALAALSSGAAAASTAAGDRSASPGAEPFVVAQSEDSDPDADEPGRHDRDEDPAAAGSRKLFDNWNTAACAFTDEAAFDVQGRWRVDRIEVWYHWQANESSVPYEIFSNDGRLGSGVLVRESCDPYQSAWCIGADRPDAEISAGHYRLKVERPRACQNTISGGNGMIRLYGSD